MGEGSSSPKGDTMSDLLTTKDVASKIGLKQITIIKHIERGNLHAEKLGGSWIIRQDDYQQFKQWHDKNSRKPAGIV